MRIPCDICYEPFNTNERKPMIPDCCGHTMCLQCVDKLPEKKCPMDQKPFHTCNLNIAINELIQMPRIKPPRDYENLFKICFVGESGVGKSTLLNRLIGSDINDTEVTIGLDMRFRSELYHNKRYKFQLWDTGGQERFRAITKAHYKSTQY
jgi:putative ribosome biogenesis GTPase RsgA